MGTRTSRGGGGGGGGGVIGRTKGGLTISSFGGGGKFGIRTLGTSSGLTGIAEADKVFATEYAKPTVGLGEKGGTNFKNVRAAAQTILRGINLPSLGFEFHGGSGYGSNELRKLSFAPTMERNNVRSVLKSLGYVSSGVSKMMGGSETIENFRNPEYPAHRLQLHIVPKTVMGEKQARMDITVRSS